MVVAMFLPAQVAAQDAGTVELISNGDFSGGTGPWWSSNVPLDASTGTLTGAVPATANPWEALIGQGGIPLVQGNTYTLSLDVSASAPLAVTAKLQLDGPPYTAYFQHNLDLTTSVQTFSYTFTSGYTDPNAVFLFELGAHAAPYTIHIDNVSLQTSLAPPPPTEPGELILNPDFALGSAQWWATNPAVATSVNRKVLRAQVLVPGSNRWDAIVGQDNLPLRAGAEYTLTVRAWASGPVNVPVFLQHNGAPWTTYLEQTLNLTTTPTTFSYTFVPSADDIVPIQFQMGGLGKFIAYIDSVSLVGPEPTVPLSRGELFYNADFSSNELAPFHKSGSVEVSFSDGVAAATIITDGGVNSWDAFLGQHGIPLFAGEEYTLTMRVWASTDVTVTSLLQHQGGDYHKYFISDTALTTTPQEFSYTFIADADDNATFEWQIGGKGPFTLYVDYVHMEGPKPTIVTEDLPKVGLNQQGFLPGMPKIATINSGDLTPLPWSIYDSAGTQVLTGMTTVFGYDAASNQHLHHANFSWLSGLGTEFILGVGAGGATQWSHPFTLTHSLYSELKYDALRYFYHNRSGIAITMPFAEEEQWTRPAGHVGVAPNQGDYDVPAFVGTAGGITYTGCNYTLDVAGGWYDAGDHGKYVINGGIALWTLLNQYERAKYEGKLAAFADGTLNIPESQNTVSDLLDEARWELEFILSMQVPADGMCEGQALGGMVHSKIHDNTWTPIPLMPSEDPQPRYLYPPTTAATLNMAAVAAQAARIWQQIDKPFAKRCRKAAEKAWEAAKANPDVYANPSFDGGGPYDDQNVADEFYWAAAELFVTTGDHEYSRELRDSPYFPAGAPNDGSAEHNTVILGAAMDWGNVETLGTISLALARNAPYERPRARQHLVRLANGYMAALGEEGFGVPLAAEGGYAWGSNSGIMNNMIILGLAYDITRMPKYLNGLSQGMDYLLGRNPNDKAYISGYGDRPLENPTHHFWAQQASPLFPPPPPGAVAGGPNPFMQDPAVIAAFPFGPPSSQGAYVDDIGSYSTNEVAINWNAPLAWLTAFLDEHNTVSAKSY